MVLKYIAGEAAEITFEAFCAYDYHFRSITRRARSRFRYRAWSEAQGDEQERLNIYQRVVDSAVEGLRAVLGTDPFPREFGIEMRRAYNELIADRPDPQIAETFYNSVIRRVFSIVGGDAAIQFVTSDHAYCNEATGNVFRSYEEPRITPDLIAGMVHDLNLHTRFRNLELDSRLCAEAIGKDLGEAGAGGIRAIEVARSVFFRNKGAYLVARIRLESGELAPLILAIIHDSDGAYIDAALTRQDEASNVFSFTQAYFQVETKFPGELLAFLHSIMPFKTRGELYNSIGYDRHGKTELYRDLIRELEVPDARFVYAEGKRGMVMIVFTLPSYPIVFKLIRDRFKPPKQTSREEVMQKYRLVFTHDRVGRLADAAEFEHLQFRRECFEPALLEELLEEAGKSVLVEGNRIILKHLYTERRVRPLDVYLAEAGEAAAHDAIIDCGRAIKDLAATNIFPGDLLLKNFGVTRHGRVIFYDYDELCLLHQCNFRAIPPARSIDDEMSPDPWFSVGESDIFPEEFVKLMIPAGPLREVFKAHHGDLFDWEFWREMQRKHQAGEIMDVFPYRNHRRIHLSWNQDFYKNCL